MNTTSGANHTQMIDVYVVELRPLAGILAQNWWAVALRGVLGILFGLVAFFLPGTLMLSIILIFAGYLLADGVLGIVAAVRRAARRHDRWGWLTFEGILSIVTGVIAALWPRLTLVIFVLIVAAWAVVSGTLMFAAAFNLDTKHGRWWLALGGLISIAFGVLLIVAPLLGALVLTWWLGAYALAFGIVLVILAFRLRSGRSDRSDSAVAHGTI
jgi:uncharacterized membrane protein HdeD (DUF308 family)